MNSGDRTFIGTRDDRLDRLRERNSQKRVPVGDDTPEWPPRVEVTPFTTTDDVWWSEGKPRCTRHRGVCLVPATAVGLTGDGHVCAGCMRETRPVGDDTPAPTADRWSVVDGELRYRYAPGAWVGIPRDRLRSGPDGDRAYDDLVALVRRAGATPDLTDEHPHGGPSRLALMRRNGELRAEIERLRAGATPDLTAPPTAEQVQHWQALYGHTVLGLSGIQSVLDAQAALVRSAQNDTDGGTDGT